MSEKESYKSPELNSSENDEVEIDWRGYLRKLIAARKALLWSVIIGVVLGVVIALSMPKEYTVAVTLSPEMGDESKSAGGLASLASSFLGGSTASGGSDALNVSLSSDIVASTPFVLGLFDVRVQTIDNSLDTTLVAYLDEQKSPWWSYILSSPGMVVGWVKSWFTKDSDDEVSTSVSRRPFQLTEKEAQKVATIKSMVAATVDSKTAITTVSVTMQDPLVAAIVADSVVQKLQTYFINYRIAKAKDQCVSLSKMCESSREEYYALQKKLAVFLDANKNIALQSVEIEKTRLENEVNLAYQIYSQVASQLQMTQTKMQEAKPAFAVLEPATVPLQPSGTSRKMILMAVTFVAIILTAGWKLLGEELWGKTKDLFKEK